MKTLTRLAEEYAFNANEVHGEADDIAMQHDMIVWLAGARAGLTHEAAVDANKALRYLLNEYYGEYELVEPGQDGYEEVQAFLAFDKLMGEAK